jgi:Na+/phosphate symporter
MNPKNCTIFALGLLAGTAVTLCALPSARREAQRKTSELGDKIANRIENIENTVSETSAKTREGIRKIGENITTQKQAVANSLTAAKEAYRTSAANA